MADIYWREDQRSSADEPDRAAGAPRSGAELWAKARAVKTQVKLSKRWHKDVNTWYKRLWLVFKGSHTLLAGLLYRGTVGFSRAQTVMILSNSVVLELVVLCMQYTVDTTDIVDVDIVTIVASGTFAALVCIPGMLVFAAAFHPQAPAAQGCSLGCMGLLTLVQSQRLMAWLDAAWLPSHHLLAERGCLPEHAVHRVHGGCSPQPAVCGAAASAHARLRRGPSTHTHTYA